MIYHETEHGTLFQGECLETLRTLPAESVNCCVTSPPYWGLRDYGHSDQLGLEPTFDEYIAKLCDIFDEVKRVLRNDGTLWVNLGDTYSTMSGNAGKGMKYGGMPKFSEAAFNSMPATIKTPLPDKSLCLIPFRFALEMQSRGWIVRNTIIWHKPNCMPSSVKDRFTVDFEYVFFFVKSKKYWFETQYEAMQSNAIDINRMNPDYIENHNIKTKQWAVAASRAKSNNIELGRNKRAVWTITTKPYKEAHFAVYPPELIETPIKAGCPEFVCKKCGKAREKIINLGKILSTGGSDTGKMAENADAYTISATKCKKLIAREHIHEGYTDCGCNAGFEPGTVLDPFMGSGTTAIVAIKQAKRYVGIELNPEYCEIAARRIDTELDQSDIFR